MNLQNSINWIFPKLELEELNLHTDSIELSVKAAMVKWLLHLCGNNSHVCDDRQ